MKYLIKILTACVVITLVACNQGSYPHYIEENNPNKESLEELLPLLDRDQEHSENRFTIMSEIISKMLKQESVGKLNLLINTYMNNNPEDPYNSYYLLLLASAYVKSGQNNFAIPYLHKITKSYPDLDINGLSTHYTALTTLVDITSDSLKKVNYYKTLINNHEDRVQNKKTYTGGIGELYYYLGKAYEECEMWAESIKSFETFLSFKEAFIPFEPEARKEIGRKISFHYSNKKWVVSNLDSLIWSIRRAISRKDPRMLDRYRAHDFFIINWKSDSSDVENNFPMKSSVLTSMSITTKRHLDPMSNENERYLEVNGNRWSSIIWSVYPKWYFYFKRVDYPMNPNIHGGWEWAGIYLGEKL